MSDIIEKNRCFWANPKNPDYIRYHDEEWGRQVHDDAKLLELLILESFQAGLSWECILNKREAFREAFDGFNRDSILAFDSNRIELLMRNPGIIRNRAKINAAVTNTVVFKAIQDDHIISFRCHFRRSSQKRDEICRLYHHLCIPTVHRCLQLTSARLPSVCRQ